MMITKKGWLAAGLLAWSLSAGLVAVADELPPPPESASEATEATQSPAQDAPAAPAQESAPENADK